MNDIKPVWPDFIAPPKYDNPDPRWQDPALPDFRLIWKVARECGYAVGLHGSMKRDCDLIAVPWTDEAVLAFDLIYRLCEALNAQVLGPVAGKPHGRLGWNIQVDGYVKVIDISVVPRSQDRAMPALERIGTGLYETQPAPDPALRPTMTDMMVDPDTLDAFMEANPLPPDPAPAKQVTVSEAEAIREAALHVENAKRLRRYDWQEWTAQDVEDAEGIICAFLALIQNEKETNQ